MASEISNGTTVPHATDYSDLLDKLVAFAVGTGGWEIVSDQLSGAGEIYLKGLDYSGDKNIFIGIKKIAAPIFDIFGWNLQGYTSFNNLGFFANPGAIPGNIPVLPLWNDTIPYWFFVNPRRIIVVARLSGVYVAIYMGLILPYGSTGQWSYPLAIGGTGLSTDAFGNMNRYSDNSINMCVPFMPIASNFCLRVPTGQWIKLNNGASSFTPPGGNSGISTNNGISPYCDRFVNGGGANNGYRQLRPNLDDKYTLKPLRIMRGDTPDCYGLIDGVKFVAGYGLSTEDTIADGGDDYIVFQDTFRTDLFSFFVVKDE